VLTVNSIDNGIVIDHIRAGLGIKLFHYLGLDKVSFPVALIQNCESRKFGRKDIIKIQSPIELSLEKLGLIDPNITVSVIENGGTARKLKLSLPRRVEDVIRCKNPRCVTAAERGIPHIFTLVDVARALYQCEYCEELQSGLEL